MNKTTANLLYVILIATLILFMIWMVAWLKTESKDCVENPINYFKEKNPDIQCSCYKDGNRIEELSDNVIYNINP